VWISGSIPYPGLKINPVGVVGSSSAFILSILLHAGLYLPTGMPAVFLHPVSFDTRCIIN